MELSAIELIDTGLMELSAAREVAGGCQMESKEQMMERKPRPFHLLHNAHCENTLGNTNTSTEIQYNTNGGAVFLSFSQLTVY